MAFLFFSFFFSCTDSLSIGKKIGLHGAGILIRNLWSCHRKRARASPAAISRNPAQRMRTSAVSVAEHRTFAMLAILDSSVFCKFNNTQRLSPLILEARLTSNNLALFTALFLWVIRSFHSNISAHVCSHLGHSLLDLAAISRSQKRYSVTE